MSKNVGKARALLDAAVNGDVQKLDELLGKKGNPDLVGADGRTALMNASGGHHVEATRRLLRAGADVNRESNGGATALSYAVKPDYAHHFTAGKTLASTIEIVRVLLTAGAKVSSGTLVFAINHQATDVVDALLRSPVKNDAATLRRALVDAADEAYEANVKADVIAKSRRLIEAALERLA